MRQPSPPADNLAHDALADAPPSPSRRQWLGMAGALSLGAVLLPLGARAWSAVPPAALPAEQLNRFHALSQLLTGREHLDADLSARVLTLLTEAEPAFPQQAEALGQALARAGIAHIKDYPGSPVEQDAAHKQTAMAIIGAWYLGYTGTPKSGVPTDDTRFVTYTGALMFEPTADATVIPTYARGGTNYWQHPPAHLAAD